MITYIKIDGFKSFKDFEMYFSPLTVIAGLNASGKSNLFDALRLLSALSGGEKLSVAMQSIRGESDELFLQYHNGKRENKMSFTIDLLLDKTVSDNWGTKVDVAFNRLRYSLTLAHSIDGHEYFIEEERLEPIHRTDDIWLKSFPETVRKNIVFPVLKAKNKPFLEIKEQDGKRFAQVSDISELASSRRFYMKNSVCTMLSRFDNADYVHIYAARKEMMKWMYLQLEPEALRLPSPKNISNIQLMPNGEYLPNVLYALKKEDEYNLTVIARKVNHFLPNLVDIDVKDDKENNRYILQMKDKNGIWFSSRTLSEGTLRIISLCVLAVNNKLESMLCYEEPENGVNPQRVLMMAELMADLSSNLEEDSCNFRQVIVNTHSPLFVQSIDSLNSKWSVICFSRMVSSMLHRDESVFKFSKTKITPILKKGQKPLLDYSVQDIKLSIRDINDYLKNENYTN